MNSPEQISTINKSLFKYCKEGSLTKIQSLVEDNDIDLNFRDEWDSTPLYYACLCGHFEIVEYLLQKGSRCPENTFDGERCLYGALSEEIKNLVRNWKQVNKSGLRRNKHYELMTDLLDRHPFSDVLFIVHGDKFFLHKCILVARSEYFATAFATKWLGKDMVNIKSSRIQKESFRATIQYIYTGRLDIDYGLLKNLKSVAKNCKLFTLLKEISNAETRYDELKRLKPHLKKRVNLFTVENLACTSDLHNDLRKLVDHIIPPSANDWVDQGVLPFTTTDNKKTYYADVCFIVEGHSFYAHKAFLVTYSEYFRARCDDHFCENYLHDTIPIVCLNDMSLNVFKSIVLHAYADAFELSTFDETQEVLAYSHMFMMSGLSRRCGLFLSKLINNSNFYSIYKSSKYFDLSRLEAKCTFFMAKNLDKIVNSEEFSSLVLEDAMSVMERQETDSVPLVDDIRHHLTQVCQTISEYEENKLKLHLLDVLMSRLGIDC